MYFLELLLRAAGSPRSRGDKGGGKPSLLAVLPPFFPNTPFFSPLPQQVRGDARREPFFF